MIALLLSIPGLSKDIKEQKFKQTPKDQCLVQICCKLTSCPGLWQMNFLTQLLQDCRGATAGHCTGKLCFFGSQGMGCRQLFGGFNCHMHR
jgi:hypothetical protein